MTRASHGTVLFGDVVDSRRDQGASAWLRALRADLDDAYPRAERLAPFGFTQGDEVQGVLAEGVDPFRAVIRAGLQPDARALRWAIVAGPVDPGTGPATERTGPAFHAARDVLARVKAGRTGLVAITGDPATDELLADLGPLLPALLEDLTPRQREIGRLMLVESLRQAEAADRLGVSRATVSVTADRGRIRHLEGLAHALATLFLGGTGRAERAHGDERGLAGTGSAA
jgi:DNA-binding XRE family transcriptional regulator